MDELTASDLSGYDFELRPDGSIYARDGRTITGRVGYVGEPLAPPPPPRVPTDSLGTPVHTAVVFTETVATDLLSRDGVAELVHKKLDQKITTWCEANGYSVVQVDIEADRETTTLLTVTVRATAHLIPREDGEWPSIRRAVHEDQLEIAKLQARATAFPTVDPAAWATALASTTDSLRTFSDRMSDVSAAFRPWTASLPAPPLPGPPAGDRSL